MLAAFIYFNQIISYIPSSSSNEVFFQNIVLVSALLHDYSSKPLLIPQLKGTDTTPREKHHSPKEEMDERGFTETLLPGMLQRTQAAVSTLGRCSLF